MTSDFILKNLRILNVSIQRSFYLTKSVYVLERKNIKFRIFSVKAFLWDVEEHKSCKRIWGLLKKSPLFTYSNLVLQKFENPCIYRFIYLGTWLADFPMNHYTHWVGLLLKPNETESNLLRKQERYSSNNRKISNFFKKFCAKITVSITKELPKKTDPYPNLLRIWLNFDFYKTFFDRTKNI